MKFMKKLFLGLVTYIFVFSSAHNFAEQKGINYSRMHEYEEKPMCVVVASYNNSAYWEWNIRSILQQEYANISVIITDDNSPDGTGAALHEFIKNNNLEDKVKLIRNSVRKGALFNYYLMIHSCPPESIIVTLDGDDAFPDDPYVLKKLNAIYSNPEKEVWYTYGQFQLYPQGTKGWCRPIPEDIVRYNRFRTFPHLPSHLRTFYAWLFQAIKLEDLLYLGEFYQMTWDYAFMFPMIEMAGSRHQFIDDIMYLYNTQNEISDHKVSRQLQAYLAQVIRAKPKYHKLRSSLLKQKTGKDKADIIIFSESGPKMLKESLESIVHHMSGYGQIHVLYYGCAEAERVDYQALMENYSDVNFHEIQRNPNNFRELLKQVYLALSNKYIIFSLDQNKVIDDINLNECIDALEKTHAYCFFLKLSKLDPIVPYKQGFSLIELDNDLCAWDLSTANGLWSCANNIHLTLYRREKSIIETLECKYMEKRPLGFAAIWANEGKLDKVGLCFYRPKVQDLK